MTIFVSNFEFFSSIFVRLLFDLSFIVRRMKQSLISDYISYHIMLVVERGMFISGYLQARFFSSISVAVMGSGSFLFSGLKNFIEKSLNSPSFHISCLISSPTTNTGSKSKKGKSRSIESLAGV